MGAKLKLSQLLWSPVRENETWALTFVRVTGNLLRWIIGIPVIVILAFLGYFQLQQIESNRPKPIEHLEKMARISIGMTPDEVTVSNGEPDRRTQPEILEGEERYSFLMRYFGYVAFFRGASPDEMTVKRICNTDMSYGVDYNGVRSFSSESDVIKLLGVPDRETIHDDKLGKALYFNDANMIIHFDASIVETVCIGIDAAIK